MRKPAALVFIGKKSPRRFLQEQLAKGVTFAALSLIVSMTPALVGAADDEATVRKLEQACEEAREARLKPLREAEIKRCIEEQGKDPAYCQRYWSDLGNAVRLPNGRFQPRKFDDLPECVAAQEARSNLNR
jgi:hypothetical protein